MILELCKISFPKDVLEINAKYVVGAGGGEARRSAQIEPTEWAIPPPPHDFESPTLSLIFIHPATSRDPEAKKLKSTCRNLPSHWVPA